MPYSHGVANIWLHNFACCKEFRIEKGLQIFIKVCNNIRKEFVCWCQDDLEHKPFHYNRVDNYKGWLNFRI